MDYIRNYLITFAGNFTFSYYIFEEGTFAKPLMFATFIADHDNRLHEK